MILLLFSLVILHGLIAFYFFAKKRNDYWKERSVTTVKTNFFMGTMYDLVIRRLSLEQIHEAIYWAEPDKAYVGIHNMLKPILFLRDPELIHRIMVKDFSHFHDRQEYREGLGRLNEHLLSLVGEEWKNVRNKLVPAFSANKLKKMYDLIEECADTMIEHHFRPLVKAGKTIDVKGTMERFSLDVIGKCAFGLQFNSLQESESLYQDVGKAFTATGFIEKLQLGIIGIYPRLAKFFGIKLTSTELENFFVNLLHQAEKLRRSESNHRNDLLQVMLDMKYKDVLNENHVLSNMFAFYVAGHEPTSHAITFALYELSLNPEIQEKLRIEIVEAREANGGILDYVTIKKMVYLDMVVTETLRLHATNPVQNRVCTKAYEIPGSSLVMKPGQLVVFAPCALHKDEKYFPNPYKFEPERFSKENSAEVNPFTYFPFGMGPRKCIGARFAELEIKISLAAILSRFKVSQSDMTEVPIVLKRGGFFHSPENEVWLTIEEIDQENC